MTRNFSSRLRSGLSSARSGGATRRRFASLRRNAPTSAAPSKAGKRDWPRSPGTLSRCSLPNSSGSEFAETLRSTRRRNGNLRAAQVRGGPSRPRLLRLIRASFKASHGIYGSPRVFLDLREGGETCSKHRVARLMRANNIRALHGYRTRHYSSGKSAVIAPDLVKRNFDVIRLNKVWVTDITYIRTWQGWLYLAVVMDLLKAP